MAEIWGSFDQKEKDVFVRMQQEQKEKYDEYVKLCLEKGIDIGDKGKVNLVFPTTRIKNIMKQDKSVRARAEAVIYMNKAVELFGKHMITVMKRNIGAKKKLELKDLWEAINVDRSLAFLQPLIDDYSNHQLEKSVPKKRITLEIEKSEKK